MVSGEFLELLKSWWAVGAIAVVWAVSMWMLRDPKRRGFRLGSVVALEKAHEEQALQTKALHATIARLEQRMAELERRAV